MKLNMLAITWIFVAALVFAAGCTSLGDNGGSGTTSQNPSTTTVVSPGAPQGTTGIEPVSPGSSYTPPPVLTEAQKTRATSISKDSSDVKDILNKPGYTVTGVMDGGAEFLDRVDANTVAATVVIMGGDTQHDGTNWTPDQYNVIVDVNGNKVLKVIHIEQKRVTN